MQRLTPRAPLVALALALPCALAAQAPRDSLPLRALDSATVRVRPARETEHFYGVYVAYPGNPGVRVHLNRVSASFTVDSVRLLAASRRGATTYLLLSVHGPSRSPRNDGRGYCGAGDERAVVALEMVRGARGARPRIRRAQGALFDSCLFSVNQADPEEGLRMDADSAWGEWHPYDREREGGLGEKRPMRYLFRAPERGLHAAEPR